jgi:hypothetical protein
MYDTIVLHVTCVTGLTAAATLVDARRRHVTNKAFRASNKGKKKALQPIE